MKLVKTLMLLSIVPGLLISKAYAYNCAGVPAYSEPTNNRYDAGSIVQNRGSAYQCVIAGWCDIGGFHYAPGTGQDYRQAWNDLGACTTTTSSVASSVVTVSSARSSVANSVVASSVTSGCSGVAAWSSTAIYTQGNRVSYNGQIYQAQWWTQNENPSTSGQWGVWRVVGNCGSTSSVASSITSIASSSRISSSIVASSSSARSSSVASSSTSSTIVVGGKKVVGYFAQWGTYARNYHVKNIATSGSASKLTHILYAFGNVQGGQCVIGDSYADYERAYTADQSVDGIADTWDQPLRGSFNQLRKLKKAYPNIKVIWSFGGWTWSGGFGQAAANPTAFANSCYSLVEDPRWADVFDGIDIDWEYPNDCGLTCDTSGFSAYKNMIQALRTRFGAGALVTSAIGAAPSKINAADYAGAAQYLDFIMPMTYDYFGAFAAQGPTAPHSPLFNFPSIPTPQFYSDAAVQLLKSKGIPASKILLGVGFYGRGWTGVSQAAPGGSASGAATGSYEPGIEDYKVLKTKCPATGTVGGTAYAYCGNNWWSYDTPQTMVGKMDYVHQQNLGGTFFWELSGDTTNGELITVIGNSMR